MDNKHTPGPWRHRDSGVFDKTAVLAPTGQPGEYVTIADCDLRALHMAFHATGEAIPEGFTSANAEANARLIASAPELLEALQAAEQRITRLLKGAHAAVFGAPAPAVERDLAQIRAAIRNATQP